MAKRVQPHAHVSRGRAWGLRIAWLLLILAVLAIAGAVLWQTIGSNQLAQTNQRRALESYIASCAQPGQDRVAVGSLAIPAISDDTWPIVIGTDRRALGSGVGWDPQTAMPGENGNAVIAGYRVGNGEPFARLLDLDVGDEIVVGTCEGEFVYTVSVAPRDYTVANRDDSVLDPVPGSPGQRPTTSTITLVTSQDKVPTPDRSVGIGILSRTTPR